MNLQEFLSATEMGSKAALARSLGVSPQSLNQYLGRDSNTFQLLMRQHYPKWVVTHDGSQYDFELPVPVVGGSTVHSWSKKDLLVDLDLLNSNPAAYSFVAALDCDPIDLALEHNTQDLCVMRPGSSEVFARFPFDQVPNLVKSLKRDEEE